jgi:pyrroline-5-carboxylate reductase
MKIGFLGAGKMAEGILAAIEDKSDVIMAEKIAERRNELEKKYGVETTDDLGVVVKKAKMLILAVKPQDVADVAKTVKPLLRKNQILVSIAAGKTLAGLKKLFGVNPAIVRVMPNLALRSGAGMSAVTSSPKTPEKIVSSVASLLSKAGKAIVLKEKDFDAVTALSGSGPAYFAYMAEAMMEGGVKLGLKKDAALLLSLQTMYGTAKFLLENNVPLKDFINGVCTKGGTTAAGMTKLDNPEFKNIVADTLAAAAKRSKELA